MMDQLKLPKSMVTSASRQVKSQHSSRSTTEQRKNQVPKDLKREESLEEMMRNFLEDGADPMLGNQESE